MKKFIFLIAILSLGRISLAYDFSYTYQGKTLYYKIYTSLQFASVVNPSSSNTYYNYVSGDVVIPDSVEYNGNKYAVKRIDSYAFRECTGVTSVIIPNTVTSIFTAAFSYCTNMTSVAIPNTITIISDEAFSVCSSLTSVIIPESITTINTRTFAGCSSLTSITIPSSVTNIRSYAFYGCSNLSSITIPDSVRGIGDYAFRNDSSLTSITIGTSVISIGTWAFRDCINLTTMYCNASNPPTANNDPFYSCDFQIFVPCSSVDAYQNAPNWSNYSTHINGMPDFNFTYSFVANDETMGTVSIGQLGCDSNISVTAIVNSGYRFVGWSDGIISNSRTIHLSSDTTVIALFDHITYSVVGQSSNNAYGTVTGSNSVYYGDTVTLTAIANYGYHFTQWSDGNSNASRTITVISDMVLTAYFEINSYQLTVLPNDPTLGIVTGSGSYPHGTQVTVSATPFTGIRFDHWSDNSLLNMRTITLINDMQLVAVFTALDTIHLHDTTFINIHDTTIVYVPYTLFDTMYVDVHDTTYINVHDTTYLPIYLHDTVPMIEYLHDTIYLPQYIHDTTIVNNYFRDTIYLPQYIHDTSFVSIHDTTYISVLIHDTTYITQIDTLTLTQYDTVTNTVIDTLWLTQTDTLWLHDTIIIHDTVYITQEGIDGVDVLNAKVYLCQGQIVVEGADGNTVRLYDINGRVLANRRDDVTPMRFDVPASGTYLIKIGNHVARKVVVIR